MSIGRVAAGANDLLRNVARALGPDEWLGFFVVMSDVLVDDLHLCIIASTPMNAETGVTASGERAIDRRLFVGQAQALNFNVHLSTHWRT